MIARRGARRRAFPGCPPELRGLSRWLRRAAAGILIFGWSIALLIILIERTMKGI